MSKKIQLNNSSVVEYVEALTYETEARRAIISFMLDHDMDRTTEAFQQYHKEYLEFFSELNMVKAQIERDYVLPETNGGQICWRLDFETGEITLQEGPDA